MPVDPDGLDTSDLLPSLHGNYPASSLIRSSPPLIGASVLSASPFFGLCLFPYHRPPGSQVPYESPDQPHACSAPDTTGPISRYPPCCSRGPRVCLGFDATIVLFRCFTHRFACARLSDPHMTRSMSRLLTIRVHHRGHWTVAAYGSLKPPLKSGSPKGPPPSFVQHDAFASS